MAMGSLTQFPAGGRSLPAYVAMPPSSGVAPGVVVIHEIYGLNDNITTIANRFAAAGYAAMAVDLFGEDNPVRRAVCMLRFFTDSFVNSLNHRAIFDLKAALTWFGQQPGVDPERIGAIGFCLGGGFAVAWACTDRRLKAIAPFYGSNPRPLEATRRLCPVVGSYPERDFTTPAGRALERILTEERIPHDIKFYPGAAHSFFNDLNPVTYNAEAAEDAWNRVLAFFATHVRGAQPE
ncbi:MAG: dienelactone hydrolase family protein [Dehalococcoidia bacterium]|nr:dienelactone hydrolase family protein [Dehalococcoidia bacterium]